MADKVHQRSGTEYQIRINGNPVFFDTILNRYFFDEYDRLCKENEGEYVDIVCVRTEILMNQGNYHQMKKHFENDKG